MDDEKGNIHTDADGMELPSAYMIATMDGRYYPVRFGHFLLDMRGARIRFRRREDAAAFCHDDQRERERLEAPDKLWGRW